MEKIYFQPKGIRPQYCEAGMIHESDPYKAECKPDTVIQYVSPCVDSATPDQLSWKLETINP